MLLDSRQKRSTISASMLTFTIGEDLTCPSWNEDVYCNGPLTAGTPYMYDLLQKVFKNLFKTKLKFSEVSDLQISTM